MTGDLYGLEAEHALSFGTLFGQLGRAEMIGDLGDTAFDGTFYRVGVDIDLGEVRAIAAYEHGTSPGIFEDDGVSGTFKFVDFTLEYPFSSRVVGAVGAQFADFQANTEDLGSETTFKAGIRVPLGNSARRNNLKTPYSPGLAAAWAEVLD